MLDDLDLDLAAGALYRVEHVRRPQGVRGTEESQPFPRLGRPLDPELFRPYVGGELEEQLVANRLICRPVTSSN